MEGESPVVIGGVRGLTRSRPAVSNLHELPLTHRPKVSIRENATRASDRWEILAPGWLAEEYISSCCLRAGGGSERGCSRAKRCWGVRRESVIVAA